MIVTRKLAAILVADIVGFSRLAGADEDRILARLRALRSDLIDPVISVHNGRVVKRPATAYWSNFAASSTPCAAQSRCRTDWSSATPVLPSDRRIEFRVGVHLGDVVEETDGDLMGDGVNIAARLEGIAKPGAIALSEDAYRQVKGRLDLLGQRSRPQGAEEHRRADPGLFAGSRHARRGEARAARNRRPRGPGRRVSRSWCCPSPVSAAVPSRNISSTASPRA